MPRVIDCELMNDLVDSCAPGDIGTVTGIVKVTIILFYFYNGEKTGCFLPSLGKKVEHLVCFVLETLKNYYNVHYLILWS